MITNVYLHYTEFDCVYLDGGGFRRRREPQKLSPTPSTFIVFPESVKLKQA